jgi:hypothetical protein
MFAFGVSPGFGLGLKLDTKYRVSTFVWEDNLRIRYTLCGNGIPSQIINLTIKKSQPPIIGGWQENQ